MDVVFEVIKLPLIVTVGRTLPLSGALELPKGGVVYETELLGRDAEEVVRGIPLEPEEVMFDMLVMLRGALMLEKGILELVNGLAVVELLEIAISEFETEEALDKEAVELIIGNRVTEMGVLDVGVEVFGDSVEFMIVATEEIPEMVSDTADDVVTEVGVKVRDSVAFVNVENPELLLLSRGSEIVVVVTTVAATLFVISIAV